MSNLEAAYWNGPKHQSHRDKRPVQRGARDPAMGPVRRLQVESTEKKKKLSKATSSFQFHPGFSFLTQCMRINCITAGGERERCQFFCSISPRRQQVAAETTEKNRNQTKLPSINIFKV